MASLKITNEQTSDKPPFDVYRFVQKINGEHDLFGDGRIVTIPTFGHTPGHQSLKVRLDSGDIILTADACYLKESLTNDEQVVLDSIDPSICSDDLGSNERELARSLEKKGYLIEHEETTHYFVRVD